MNYGRRTNKAFTLIELVVAIAILVMVIFFASMIFRVSISSYRAAAANAEIMQKLRAITDQLNADFKGVRRTFPGTVRHNLISGLIRSDSIAFLANGDFQSTGQPDGRTVVGNVASIFYGLANITTLDPREKILVRRQTILTSDSFLPDSDSNPKGEYYKESLAKWKVNPPVNDSVWIERPSLDPDKEEDLVMYMAKGVDDFEIRYAEWDSLNKEFEWLPENEDLESDPNGWENKHIVTDAFKFTFTLYDSKDIIKDGRKFTHIVYLGN